MVSAHAFLLNFYVHVYVQPLLILRFSSNVYKSGYNFDCSIPLCSAVLAVKANQCKQFEQFLGSITSIQMCAMCIQCAMAKARMTSEFWEFWWE